MKSILYSLQSRMTFTSVFVFTWYMCALTGFSVLAFRVLAPFFGLEREMSELVDRGAFVLLLILASLIVFSNLAKAESQTDLNYSYSSSYNHMLILWFAGVSFFFISYDFSIGQNPGMWQGFGPDVGLLALVVFAIATPVRLRQGIDFVFQSSPLTTTLIGIGSSILLARYFLASLQPVWGMSDSFHGSWAINDLASWTSVVNQPFSGYVAHYSNILGLPLLLLGVPSDISLLAASMTLSAINIFGLLILASFSLVIFPKKFRAVGMVLIVAIGFCVNGLSKSGGLTDHLTVFGSRLVLPIALLLALTVCIKRGMTKLGAFSCALLSVMATINNAEFGFAMHLATSIGLALYTRTRFVVIYNISYVGALVLCLFWLSDGQGLIFGNVALSVTSGMTWSVPWPPVGPQIIIISILMVSLYYFSKTSKSNSELLTIHFLGFSSSIFGLSSLAYFVTVSSASPQLQVTLVPISLILSCYVAVLLNSHKDEKIGIPITMSRLALGLALSLSLIASPSIEETFTRVVPPSDGQALRQGPFETYANEIENLMGSLDMADSQAFLLVTYGASLEQVTGIKSLGTVTRPDQHRLYFVPLGSCSQKLNHKYLIFDKSLSDTLVSEGFCNYRLKFLGESSSFILGSLVKVSE